MIELQAAEPEVYQGQFGEYTITDGDRRGVIIYRSSLAIAAICFAIGSISFLWQDYPPTSLQILTPLYFIFCLALGVSLLTIHIYLAILHRTLQLFWAIGTTAALWLTFQNPEPLALTVYNQPAALIGIGFIFAALTGIYFKEAFCFNRLETKVLTPLVPLLLLGHLVGVLPIDGERALLAIWAILFIVFALRKFFQVIPSDIGDKSVFAYLKAERSPQ